jgi:SIR2-like domain
LQGFRVGRAGISREDYLPFEGESGALAGLVQAMLLTRRILFVGYSLSDDNLDRLVHQARVARGAVDRRPGGEFGTALSPGPPRLSNELWEGDVRFVNTAGPEGTGTRRLAILLDRIGMEASAAAAHVRHRS